MTGKPGPLGRATGPTVSLIHPILLTHPMLILILMFTLYAHTRSGQSHDYEQIIGRNNVVSQPPQLHLYLYFDVEVQNILLMPTGLDM